MNYIQLNNETKKYLKGDEELINSNDFDFELAELVFCEVERNEVVFKIINKSKKLFTFLMKDVDILNFELANEDLFKEGEKFVTSIDISVENDSIFSVVISIKGGKDCRFTCREFSIVEIVEN